MDEFWTWMQLGFTADESRIRAELWYYLWVFEQGFDDDVFEDRELLHCYGDWYTRLHGVYSGTDSDSPMVGWFSDAFIL